MHSEHVVYSQTLPPRVSLAFRQQPQASPCPAPLGAPSPAQHSLCLPKRGSHLRQTQNTSPLELISPGRDSPGRQRLGTWALPAQELGKGRVGDRRELSPDRRSRPRTRSLPPGIGEAARDAQHWHEPAGRRARNRMHASRRMRTHRTGPSCSQSRCPVAAGGRCHWLSGSGC